MRCHGDAGQVPSAGSCASHAASHQSKNSKGEQTSASAASAGYELMGRFENRPTKFIYYPLVVSHASAVGAYREEKQTDVVLQKCLTPNTTEAF